MVYLFHTQLIGSPDDSSLGFLRSDNARRYVRQLPQYPRQNFAARFPNMSVNAVDLLQKMLVFDPNRRITGKADENLYMLLSLLIFSFYNTFELVLSCSR